MRHRALLTALVVTALYAITGVRSDLECQDRVPEAAVDATAGLYQGDRSSLSGPVIRLRYRRSVSSWVQGAVYLQYRDDTPVGGRAQVMALGGDLLLALSQPSGDILYVSIGASVDVAFSADRDLPRGPHLYGSIGVGAAGSLGPVRGVLEGRLLYGAGGPLREFSIGVASNPITRASNNGTFLINTSTFSRTNDAYRQEGDFRGYGLGYHHLLGAGWAFRGSLGISFLRFSVNGREWGTGAISVLAGFLVTGIAVAKDDVAVTVRIGPEVGGWIFTEPRTRMYPVVGVGAEAAITVAGAGLLVGGSGLLANGPAGWLTGVQPRIGVVLGL